VAARDGRGVIRVERATGALLERCFAIRRRVFVEEQGVAPADEWDGLDDACLHWVAWHGEEAVGTARLREAAGDWKAQRVAVLPEYRKHGTGAALMRALEAEAWHRGAARLLLHAQAQVVPFYERLGYTAEGPVFDEAGIPHRKMSKPRPQP
jgi:ElaA protein